MFGLLFVFSCFFFNYYYVFGSFQWQEGTFSCFYFKPIRLCAPFWPLAVQQSPWAETGTWNRNGKSESGIKLNPDGSNAMLPCF